MTTTAQDASILDLAERIDALPAPERERFNALFRVTTSAGRLRIAPAGQEKIIGYFRSQGQSSEDVLAQLELQRIVRTRNTATGDGALFNALRARRPGMKPEQLAEARQKLDAWVEDSRLKNGCDFCTPESLTPEDPFGRIYGKHSVTASNIAKYDAWSSIVFFKKHHPLDFTAAELSDYVNTGFRWFSQASRVDPWAVYPYFMWNCLSKAAASQQHGHAQVLLASDSPYEKINRLYTAAQAYARERNRDYFTDLFDAHASVGLALQHGDARVIANLTPVKEKETLIIAPARTLDDHAGRTHLKEALATVAHSFIDDLGVHSFNIALAIPPLNDSSSTLPYVARVVDRGSIFNPITDIGGMELYGESVVGSDPYRVMDKLSARFAEKTRGR
jgi:hypothetical protein